MPKHTPIDMRAPKGEYMIAFNTGHAGDTGFIDAVKITIEPAHLGMGEETAINLAEHPLYPHLRQYVLSNLKNTRG